MKCLKVEEYIKRTASVKEIRLLYQELQNYVKNQPGLQGRTLCDRVARACNHNLGEGCLDFDHVSQLVKLVELSLHGYDICAAGIAQSSPLYMEKIIFHIVKKLSTLEVYSLCSRVAGLLYSRLATAQQGGEDYCVLVRNCFFVLWNGLSVGKTKKILNPRNKLHCQMQALSFLLLLDTESAIPSSSKVPTYTEDAITAFKSSCETMTKEDASFLIEEIQTLFNRCWTGGHSSEGDGSKQCADASSFYLLFEVALIVAKVLCKTSHYSLASAFLDEIESKVSDCVNGQCTALGLGKWGIKIHSAVKAGEESGQAFTECARALRSVSADLGDREAHAVLEGCSLVVWAVESGHNKGFSGPALLALFSFLEEHQIRIMKGLKKKSAHQAESSRLQQELCVSIYKGFAFAYESILASQLEDSDILDRVLLYCKATAGLMMTELRQLSNESLLVKAVITVSNLACALYNRNHYDQAFTLVETLCRDLSKNCPVSLSVEKLSRLFMLAVQTSRRSGHFERALDWVILWLKALGDKITTHMAEPVSLWVKTKTDAARNSEEDIRLRTLRDGFGPDVPDEQIMLSLLEEELRAYKEVAADMAQERYNTLCDLLDICHEQSSHTHLRAIYLCEMAQVVCFQDFSEQTDCTAVDFIHEALRLLEEETETPENADKLKDDKAHALLWLYICTLEKNLQEAIENDRKRRDLCRQTPYAADPVINDFEYEDKQKTQDSNQVYERLHFNLAAENKLCQPLERALGGWSALLQHQALPSVRNPKQTCSSIALAAALFRLMGKPLKALEAYQLVIGLSRQLADAQGCASALCQSAKLLLDMGSPEVALAQLEQAEKALASDPTADSKSSLSVLAVLLKAQYYYSTGQVDCGVPYLCEVLKEVNDQRQSKSWYLLRVQTFQTCSSYLSLDTAQLPQTQRNCITQHGINTPDVALYESLKLLCSLLYTLVGGGLYGADSSSSSDVRFIDQGDNLVWKWLLLSEVLNSSMKLVAVRSSCGSINEARRQCLEALKLATKLQALSQCAELLVTKAELELMQGEREESKADLDKVRNLLDLCTDFSDQVKRTDVKIKPRKGRPVQKSKSPLPTVEDDLQDILSTRWITKEPIVKDQSSSPPLKAQPRRWLSCLAHEPDCLCPCCSEPCLGRATARWAATQADLVLQLDPNEASVSLKLQRTTLSRCKNLASKLKAKLTELFPAKGNSRSSLMQDVVGRVYLHMALSGLEPRLNKACGVWKVLEAGLAFVDSTPSPVLTPVRAGLLATKAIASLMLLAAKKGCTPEELFSNAWTWNLPKEDKELRSLAPSSTHKKAKDVIKNPGIPDTKKEAKKVKIQWTSSSTKEKSLFPMTPVMPKSKSSGRTLDCFDFNTVVPTLACTPVPSMKGPTSVQKAPKTASKLQFHVYEELSPVQDKPQRVPAAPKRTKKSRFKVEFSDESDSEASTQAESKEKADVLKKRTTARRAGQNAKNAPGPPAEKVQPKRQVKGKRNTAVRRPTSSEDDEILVSTRRARTRRQLSQADAESMEEPDKMRSIEEETNDVLDMSIEQLRTSDTEADDNVASDIDFEVLRRDMCLEKGELSELRHRGPLREGTQTHLTHSDIGTENLSLEDVQSLLRSAWLSLQHFPSPTIYPNLCTLLALTMGQQDPNTTAMLHTQSLGVTVRHRTIRHLARCLKKQKKASSELTDEMDAMSLNEPSGSVSNTSTEQTLSQMDIFSFPTVDSSKFPQNHCQDFIQQIQGIPPGVTVCLMSVLGVKPGEMGNSIILSRLEKGSAPVTVHINTSKQQHPISWMMEEMDSILAEQQVMSGESLKAKWWQGRKSLDCRVGKLLKDLDGVLGCWNSLLLPLTLDSELSKQSQQLCKALSARGVTISEEMLKVVLSASPVLSEEDLKSFALGVSPQWNTECDQLLHGAVSQLAERDEPKGHTVLILDKYLQKLPWESISLLKSCSVSRMPSLHSLLGLSLQKEIGSQSILRLGVDTKKVFYVLDPDANLKNTQEQFKDWFASKPGWQGVCGVAPDSSQLVEAVATKDLYIYSGHGGGGRFLDSQAVLKRQMRAASLLIGCSSAALAVRGDQEGQGIILDYLIAGCPFILGNLWNVTDRDIDRFVTALLKSWFSAGSGASLLDYMGPARQVPLLRHIIGAAPVVYGLPVHLQ
ncbi:separin [Acanthochromis polyacanthus]|uniref:separin n=1 Tax=Acanthochromis polyacanthus TaxID=80966 RepID=UPI0022340B5A|nr:separin [Acanthochromis polyacanthus]